MAVKLNARGVEKLKAGARRLDVWDTVVPGLGLRITPGGAKSWCLRYRIGRTLRRWTIGNYPHPFGLAEARKAAKDGLRDVANGHDPALAKVERRDADTFTDLADNYIEKYTDATEAIVEGR